MQAQTEKPVNRFPIQFDITGRLAPISNCFAFSGPGEILIDTDTATIFGKRHGSSQSDLPMQKIIQFSNILNVRVVANTVQFEMSKAAADEPQIVGFLAESQDQATEIAAALPAMKLDTSVRVIQSVETPQANSEALEFYQRLMSLSPYAPVTYVLLVLNIGVFVWMALNGYGWMKVNPEMAITWGSNFGPMTLNGQWWRLLTSMFLHFGLIHIAMNMYVLFTTGRLVERLFGSFHFLLIYLFAGLAGSIASLLWNPLVNSAGASGAIFGLFGAALAFMQNKKNSVPQPVMMEHSKGIVVFIIFNLSNGFIQSGIDNGAHIGGLVGGCFIGYLLIRPLEYSARHPLLTKRLGLACVWGVLALTALVGTLMLPIGHARKEAHFIFADSEVRKEDGSLRTLGNALQQKAIRKLISDRDVADKLDGEIIPRYQRLYELASTPALDASSKFLVLQNAMAKYLADQVVFEKALSNYLRTSDVSLLPQIKIYRDAATNDVKLLNAIQVK